MYQIASLSIADRDHSQTVTGGKLTGTQLRLPRHGAKLSPKRSTRALLILSHDQQSRRGERQDTKQQDEPYARVVFFHGYLSEVIRGDRFLSKRL
jgi:hypothetical protein